MCKHVQRALALALFFGSIVAWVTDHLPDGDWHTNVPCRRSPGRRRCLGDIMADLNYIGAVDREGMLADRPRIEQALHAVCGRVGVQPRRVPTDHAGGKWRLSFNRIAGGTGTLEIDVNFKSTATCRRPRLSQTSAGLRRLRRHESQGLARCVRR